MKPWNLVVIAYREPWLAQLAASCIEKILDRAAGKGYSVPDTVYVEEYSSLRELGAELERVAAREGYGYAGVAPTSCIVYMGWTGVPEVYLVLEECKSRRQEVIAGEALRAGAHAILHRSLDSYVYTLEPEYAEKLYRAAPHTASIILYLLGAGVRGYEANSLLLDLEVDRDKVEASVSYSLEDAVKALRSLGSVKGGEAELLLAAEAVKILLEAKPVAARSRLVEELASHYLSELQRISQASARLADYVVAQFTPSRLGTREAMVQTAHLFVEALARL